MYSEGLVLRPSMLTVVRRGMFRVGTSLCGRRGRWLCMRPFTIGMGVLLRYPGSIYWCAFHGAAACNGIGQSRVRGPWRVHESAGDSLLENGGGGRRAEYVTYVNLARNFALLSAV